MKNKKTINEVAELAKVSTATVSRVLNNPESVRERTRERVYWAIREVGYDTSKGEELMLDRRNKSNIILALVPGIGNVFITKAIEGIISAADIAGYECVFYRRKNKKYTYEELSSIIESVNPAGIIMMLPEVSEDILSELNKRYPMVQCSEVNRESGLPYVTINDYETGKMVANYFIKSGRKRIAMINGPAVFRYARNREKGYMDALEEASISCDPSLIINLPDTSIDSIYSAVNLIINKDNMPDAIFVAEDTIAAIVIKVALDAGVSVPEDLAVIGFDNTYICRISSPTITSVSQPAYHMGELASKMLVDQMNGAEHTHNQIDLQVDLIVRESTSL